MKNIKWAVLPVILSVFTFSSCITVEDGSGFGRCTHGTGDLVTETFNLDDFSRIELDIAADVYLTMGEEQKVKVEGRQNIIDELNIEVVNHTWDISSDKCLRNIGNMKIFITLTEVDLLKITDSGNIRSENELSVDDLDLMISGSGDFDLALNANRIDCKVSGSGDVSLSGETTDLGYSVTGSGDLDAFGMKAQNVDVKISGSGDANVWAEQYLKIRISGSGDVHYIGHPELEINITGSGTVKDDN